MEIIQILIFGIIIAAAIRQQVARKPVARRQYPMPPGTPEAETATETVAPEFPRRKHKPHKPAVPASPKAKAHAGTTSPPEGAGARTVPGMRIKMDTREEARRAFIYSEIFNRKY